MFVFFAPIILGRIVLAWRRWHLYVNHLDQRRYYIASLVYTSKLPGHDAYIIDLGEGSVCSPRSHGYSAVHLER